MPKKRRKKPGKPGRPTKFNEKLALRIMELAKKGYDDVVIAEKTGIAVSTLNNWKGNKEGFLAALQASKDVASDLVEAALFQRAVGYSHPDVKVFLDKEYGIITEPLIKHYPPDTDAAKYWLKNRRPKRWQDKTEHEHTGKVSLEQILAAAHQKEASDGESED